MIETSNNNNDATNLTLGWDYTCGQCQQCNIGEASTITFKIYWIHEEWLACDVKKNVSTHIVCLSVCLFI